ncbi:uncharacterized protein N7479_009009 [Penicillium vulpinum]|uniref:PBSP domain-containing protein n=1 Tax=Penicillium vulpinum TaxID=29845 RepID=A0A1V6RTC1_9EURO|nr:uncharacterized protein N7479_009009 [Penicillium vulpinum]KAJ5950596.1 hypothetical protein N7479_009009 [Penicillium vulpinum]OQE05022.1 hypothetical protein PENVUL_c028G06976 [Penicillium vulpinum]
MTSSAPAPRPSAIPKDSSQKQEPQASSGKEKQTNLPTHPTTQIPQPKLRLHVEHLRHPASSAFLTLIPDVASTLDNALENIVKYLYTPPPKSGNLPHRPTFTPSIPPTRSVTVFLRDYSGVAYTTGTELDDAHKEIHVSLPYVQHCTSGPSAKEDPLHELVGVLTHELVHCYQHTAPPSRESSSEDIPHPPGGLIEGIADFVRLKAGLEPPHWNRPLSAAERPPKWDAGYQHTAYFLAWIEDVKAGRGAVGMLNDRLLRVGYVGEGEGEDVGKQGIGFWKGLFGVGVAELWEEYGLYLDNPTKVGAGRSSGNWEDEILNPE